MSRVQVVDLSVTAEDGRSLRVFDSGVGEVPVLSIHGAGMGRIVYAPYLEMATRRGIRVLSYDRPGLGGSTRQSGYRIRDSAADVRAIAAALKLETVLVWGVSAGVPYALACAALLPDLVAAAAALGGRAAPAIDASPESLADPPRLLAELEAAAAMDRERSVPEWVDVLSATGLPAADIDHLKTSGAQWYAQDAKDALAVGGAGYFDQVCAGAQYWGFDLHDIRVPVLIVHGLADTWVDPQAAQELAAAIPGAELRLVDGVGHLSLMEQLDDVVDWLLAHGSAPPRG